MAATTATSYTIEHHRKHPFNGEAGSWYRLRLNYEPRMHQGKLRVIKSVLSLYEERERVERYVARYHPDLPELREQPAVLAPCDVSPL